MCFKLKCVYFKHNLSYVYLNFVFASFLKILFTTTLCHVTLVQLFSKRYGHSVHMYMVVRVAVTSIGKHFYFETFKTKVLLTIIDKKVLTML